jgi:glycosyltransferase involved in cell wall biosynthesis
VALGAFDSSPLQRRRMKIASRTGSSIVIGSCGQIDVAFKGHRFVVEAIARLNRQGYDFSYELVGAGNAEHILGIAQRVGVGDRVRVLGQKRRDDVFRWLETIDIYAQPSLTEGMPRGLIEAMSRAVPSVGSIAGGIPELLPSRCLFKKGDVAQLADTLRFVNAHQDEIAREMFDKAKEYDEPLINARRKKFFLEFKESIGAGR